MARTPARPDGATLKTARLAGRFSHCGRCALPSPAACLRAHSPRHHRRRAPRVPHRPRYRGSMYPRPIDEVIAALAARQHGVVARAQLVALGLGHRAIDHRVACGRLHVVHHGVYAVGHRRLTRRGHWMAAVLAAGPGAMLSHRSAAALWDLHRSARTAYRGLDAEPAAPPTGHRGAPRRGSSPTRSRRSTAFPSPPSRGRSSTSPPCSPVRGSSERSSAPRRCGSPTPFPSMSSFGATPAARGPGRCGRSCAVGSSRSSPEASSKTAFSPSSMPMAFLALE